MASQTLNSPEYKAVYAAISASTYWYRQGALVKAPRYADRIEFSNGGLRLKLGANHLNLTAVASQITWRIHYLLKLFDGNRNAEGLALKVVLTEKRELLELHLQDAISCCVERYDNESYSNCPITNGFLSFGSIHVYARALISTILLHSKHSEYADAKYWP